jgi:hypothetical protein
MQTKLVINLDEKTGGCLKWKSLHRHSFKAAFWLKREHLYSLVTETSNQKFESLSAFWNLSQINACDCLLENLLASINQDATEPKVKLEIDELVLLNLNDDLFLV